MFGTAKPTLCDRCKAPIIARSYNAKYCKACVPAAGRERYAQWYRNRSEKRAQAARKQGMSIAQIAQLARAAGLSYGEFVGRMEGGLIEKLPPQVVQG